MTPTLAENRLQRKRNAVSTKKAHLWRVKGTGRKREIRSPLQAIFLRRVEEELRRQGISRNQLSKRVGAPRQSTFNDVMLGADPRLETVHQVATALGVPAISLLTESGMPGAVYKLPAYPLISAKPDPAIGKKIGDRKKSAR